jgi:hypothetical protein
MGCNCMKSSKADNEEQETLTPRIVQSASRNHVHQPPMTKGSVPQQYVATKAIGGEEVDATSPSISPAAETVRGSATYAEILPNPITISSINGLSKGNTVSSTFIKSAAGGETVKPATPPKSAQHESMSLWKAAYDEVKNTDAHLIKDLETVIKADASISAETDLKEQIALVVRVQKDRMESKQWSFPWFNKTLKVREVVDNIFSMLDKSNELISMGMNYAPIYVSIPWSAVAALLPVQFDLSSSRSIPLLTAFTAHNE